MNESPGKLPGMVRAENIRFTHFSRNPKIAEFLKAYDFVKEYGEGVDRMCKELEKAGQKSPEYYTNAFMLQTVIYNSKNPTIHTVNRTIYNVNPTIQEKKLDFTTEKIKKDTLNAILSEQSYFAKTKQNLLEVYNSVDINQVFGAPEVKKILGCTDTASKDIMKKLRNMGIITEVKGKGKGKYRFLYEDEIENLV